jgi:Tol biopolymer transport system component
MKRMMAVVFVVAACGSVDPEIGDPDGSLLPDGDVAIVDGAPDAVEALGPWSAPVRIGELSMVGFHDWYPALRSDGLEMYFVSNRDGYDKIYVTTRFTTADPWDTPSRVVEIDLSASSESGPALSADGRTIWFTGNASGQTTGHDIFTATRAGPSDPWTGVTEVVELNTVTSERAPHVLADGLTMYFARDDAGDYEIYVATRSSSTAPWDDIRRVPRLSSPSNDSSPTVTGDGLELYLHREAGGVFEIMRATKSPEGGAWSLPEAVAELAGAHRPEVSSDGRTMLLSLTAGDGLADIYESHR